MLLLIETWSAACCWFSDCTSCSMVRPDSDSRCSIQVSGNASAGLCPCSRRASSATNGARHRRVGPRHVRDHQDQALRVVLGDLRHLVRPGVGQVPVDPAGGDAALRRGADSRSAPGAA